MRVRVSLDFDILIESCISLCIIETVLAIFREYKPWIVLVIIEEFCTMKCLLSMIGVIIWEKPNLLGKQGMISCTWMKHGLTKITAQIFKPLKKDNTIHLLVIVTILWFGQKH
jgi:hypothetical protein